MASERDDRDETTGREEPAREQEESYKLHGDKLEPIIPRGADQQGDATEADRVPRPER